ncbi:MAG TPA: hypothetical protein VFE45_16460 [Coriobacteriia bacterium]|nr:hypothetical protein [Coriobacteriia bacterium]
MEIVIYILLGLFFAILLGFNVWAARSSSIAGVKQPTGARVLRLVNTLLLAAALGIVLWAIVRG